MTQNQRNNARVGEAIEKVLDGRTKRVLLRILFPLINLLIVERSNLNDYLG